MTLEEIAVSLTVSVTDAVSMTHMKLQKAQLIGIP